MLYLLGSFRFCCNLTSPKNRGNLFYPDTFCFVHAPALFKSSITLPATNPIALTSNASVMIDEAG